MKEIEFKNHSSISSRKKDIFLKEAFERDGVITKTERRCLYFIKEIIHLGTDDIQKWAYSETLMANAGKRHFHIIKEHDDALLEDKVVCKIAGTFYAIAGRTVYTIWFLHSFKVSSVKVSIKT